MRNEVENKSELEKARILFWGMILEGLRHGYFKFEITGEEINGRKRRLTIGAGKSHRFVIPEEELAI